MKRTRLLLLSNDTFRSVGGIQQVSKNLTYTLGKIARTRNLKFNANVLHDDLPDVRYVKGAEFRGFRGRLTPFLLSLIPLAKETETVVLSHINLLPVAFIFRLFNKRCKVVLIAHGIEMQQKLSLWQVFAIGRLVKIWAVSDFTREVLEKQHKVKRENIAVLPNCLSPFFKIPQHFSKSKKLVKKYGIEGKEILLSVTRISKYDQEKGYDKVINALPDLIVDFPNIHYLLCGQQDTEERLRLQLMIRELNLQKHVSFLNFIPEEVLTEHYLLADVFILPSTKEGFGISFIEAAACGRKIIAGNIDGSKDALLNGTLGDLINPLLPQAIKEAISSALKSSNDRHKTSLIQKKCLQHFTISMYEKKVISLLDINHTK